MYFRNGINHIIYIICAVSESVPYQVEKGGGTSAHFFPLFVTPVNSRKDPESTLLNFQMYCKVACTRRTRVDEN